MTEFDPTALVMRMQELREDVDFMTDLAELASNDIPVYCRCWRQWAQRQDVPRAWLTAEAAIRVALEVERA